MIRVGDYSKYLEHWGSITVLVVNPVGCGNSQIQGGTDLSQSLQLPDTILWGSCEFGTI